MDAEWAGLLIGLGLIAGLAPFGAWAIRFAKRQRGGAVVLSGLLLVFGMNMTIEPPPPPRTEQVQRQAEDDQDRDKNDKDTDPAA